MNRALRRQIQRKTRGKGPQAKALGLAGAATLVVPGAFGLVQLTSSAPAVASGITNTYVVNTTSDTTGSSSDVGGCSAGGSCSLREAIHQYNEDTSGSDVIKFSVQGVFGLGSKIAIDNTHGVPLTIMGRGSGMTIVDGNGTEVFDVEEGGPVTLSGLTVRDGAASEGGGIYNDSPSPVTLSGVVVNGNNAGDGGGVYNVGTLNLVNSTVSQNTATDVDGVAGIYNSGKLTLQDSNVTQNSSSGSSGSGGVLNDVSGVLDIYQSTITGNSATDTGQGGGIWNLGTLYISGSTLAQNSAGGTGTPEGGGLWNGGGGKATVDGGTVAYNSAEGTSPGTGEGGGIYNAGDLTVNGSGAIVYNVAGFAGGGIYNIGTETVTVTEAHNTPDP